MKLFTAEKMKKTVKALGKVVSCLSILFVIYAVYKLGFNFHAIGNIKFFLLVAFLGVCLKSVTVFISAHMWGEWLRFLSHQSRVSRKAVIVYGKANIGKYLPGNVMHYVERNIFAADMGIGQTQLALGSVFEVLSLVLASILIALLGSGKQLIAVIGQLDKAKLQWTLLVICLAVIACVCGLVIFRRKLWPVLHEYSVRDFTWVLIKAFFHYAAVLLILGIVMVLLYGYMGGTLTWETASGIVSAYVIAWVLGFIIPGASGGIGIREMVIMLLLSDMLGADTVLTLSVIHRLITIIGDFLVYLIVVVWERTVIKSDRSTLF